MAKKKNKEAIESLKKTLVSGAAGLAGLAVGESAVIDKPIDIIANTVQTGEPYEELLHGMNLRWVDPEAYQKSLKYKKYLGVPNVQVVASPETATITGTAIESIQKHPLIKQTIKDEAKMSRLAPLIGYNGRGEAFLAHEVGHNVRSPISAIANYAELTPHIHDFALGGGIGLALSGNPTAQAIAPLVAVSTRTPLLLEELRASAHGLRAIRGVEGLGAVPEAVSKLAPAFITYALAAAPAIVAPIVARAVKDYIKGKRETKQEKKASAQLRATGQKTLSAPAKWYSKPGKQISLPPKAKVRSIPKAKPPSKKQFYRDMSDEIHGKGTRRA